jgi:uncharacterized protein YacL
MYSEGGWMMVLGVLLSLGFICLMVWYANVSIPQALTGKNWLTRFVALILTAMLGVFIVDLLVSWKVKLLDDEMRKSLFELIKNIVLVVFGYQFSANKEKND